jgi:hypothetical protein
MDPIFVTIEDGIGIGSVFKVLAGWRAITLNRVEVMDKPGWNGQAYDTRADAESALHAYDQERFGLAKAEG